MSSAQDVEAMTKADTAPYVTFSLAEETYAIDVLQVQEVLKVTEIARYRVCRTTSSGSSTCAGMSLR